ncbi:DNA-binding transcriptional regulator, LysR family [Ectopseudomonas composti]|jgi:DNA-binding transcriptional LysR family regulator|uniref:DNA-binding transcriptional regulator, LysR family n=1 Tax=Ectopseudomonas composti TaxID=658457 RepID=A0A1I5JE10_9GAMM|nr:MULTISPECIES: LysR family transcriptional regulator [Pseudomonas]EZH79372.1 LysR family transcriptional regulator [Pseudomonas composti]MDP9938288.1 DNA-binding transcriptional LysR family regulator [Pseudomonas sp. 3400]MDR7010511.1 DNA-binding transcriptional LysR family regulator [Pseudomonas alcaliphila]SFO71035.1 DNA-binding transcriptional regulator, LysR family [Pseudomonas composti]
MRITLMQIEAFYWTARLGGVHAASRHLHLTQPAISSRIREMESLLDVKLFDRSKQRMTLTPDGHIALRHAELVLNNSTKLEQFAAKQKQHRRLRLGADECSAMVGLTAVIAEIKAHFPEITLEITIDVGAVLNRKLNDHELDLALLTNPATREDVTDIFIGWMTFQWVASPQFDITANPFLPEHASGHPIVTHSAPSTLYSVVESWLKSGNASSEAFHTSNSLGLMAKLVSAGHAIGILPVPLIREMLALNLLRTLPCDPPIAPARFCVSYMTETPDMQLDALVSIARQTLFRLHFLENMEEPELAPPLLGED